MSNPTGTAAGRSGAADQDQQSAAPLPNTHLGASHAAEAGPRWTVEAVDRLRDLAKEGVAAEVIAQAMHRPLSEVTAKAAELGLALRPEERST
ncbi:MAG: hypothetical protein J0I45_10730 [Bosea sp.]|nr:hypothetical protein [Bosea sp. (in: a-proteobacteria)]